MKIEFNDRNEIQTYEVQDLAKFQQRAFSRITSHLNQMGIDSKSYVLGKPDAGANGELCLHYENGLWLVYSSERGERLNPAFFASIWHAGRYLMWEIMRCNKKQFPDFPTIIADIVSS